MFRNGLSPGTKAFHLTAILATVLLSSFPSPLRAQENTNPAAAVIACDQNSTSIQDAIDIICTTPGAESVCAVLVRAEINHTCLFGINGVNRQGIIYINIDIDNFWQLVATMFHEAYHSLQDDVEIDSHPDFLEFYNALLENYLHELEAHTKTIEFLKNLVNNPGVLANLTRGDISGIAEAIMSSEGNVRFYKAKIAEIRKLIRSLEN